MRKAWTGLACCLAAWVMGSSVFGQESVVTPVEAAPAPVAAAADTLNTGDTVWVMLSAALVMLMTPGLAFFYGGLVRKKNVLSILMQCFMVMCLSSVQWVVLGYSLAFGPDLGGFIGKLD